MFKFRRILGVMLGFVAISLLSANIASAAQYYCNGRIYTDPCAPLRMTNNTSQLQFCLGSEEYKEYKKVAFSSKCEKTLTKYKSWGNCKATALMGAKTKKVINYNATDDYCLKKIKELYPNHY